MKKRYILACAIVAALCCTMGYGLMRSDPAIKTDDGTSISDRQESDELGSADDSSSESDPAADTDPLSSTDSSSSDTDSSVTDPEDTSAADSGNDDSGAESSDKKAPVTSKTSSSPDVPKTSAATTSQTTTTTAPPAATTAATTTPEPATTTMPETYYIPESETVATPPETAGLASPEPSAVHFSEQAQRILELVNNERAAAGLGMLTLDADLCNAADLRAGELAESFSHLRPDGRNSQSILDEMGIYYGWYGENIAYGHLTADDVMAAWMNSEGHRTNILRPEFGKLGVGYDPGSNSWVQIFTD